MKKVTKALLALSVLALAATTAQAKDFRFSAGFQFGGSSFGATSTLDGKTSDILEVKAVGLTETRFGNGVYLDAGYNVYKQEGFNLGVGAQFNAFRLNNKSSHTTFKQFKTTYPTLVPTNANLPDDRQLTTNNSYTTYQLGLQVLGSFDLGSDFTPYVSLGAGLGRIVANAELYYDLAPEKGDSFENHRAFYGRLAAGVDYSYFTAGAFVQYTRGSKDVTVEAQAQGQQNKTAHEVVSVVTGGLSLGVRF